MYTTYMRASFVLLVIAVTILFIITLRGLFFSTEKSGYHVGVVDGGHYFESWIQSHCESAMGSADIKFIGKVNDDTDFVLASVFGGEKNNVPFDIPIIIVSGEAHVIQPISGRTRQGLVDTKPSPAGWTFPFLYVPFYVISFGERRQNSPRDLLTKTMVTSKTKFCAYLASYDTEDRCRFFDTLSAVKKVDGLGTSRNTTGLASDRGVYNSKKTYMDVSVEKYRPYRFVIAFENTQHPGYITEKIVSAMLAGCVPIYYGARDVTKHFNPASFINVANFPSFEDCCKYVGYLESHPEALTKIQQAPFFVNNILPQYFAPDYASDFIKQVLSLP